MSPTAVITGGTGGLGTALVRRLLRRDYRLAVSYLLPEEADRFERELDIDEDKLTLRRVDATNPEAVNGFMKEIADQFGQINVVTALVGGWAGGRDVEETDDVRFERMLDLNLRSAFYAARAAIPYLRQADWGQAAPHRQPGRFRQPARSGRLQHRQGRRGRPRQDHRPGIGRNQGHLQRAVAVGDRHPGDAGHRPLRQLRQLADPR